MFKKHPEILGDIVNTFLRENGLETPLLQKRIIKAWDVVLGPTIASQTGEKYIKNQTLMVKIKSPAMRSDLSMMRTQLMQRLNDYVGSQVIYDLRIF